MNLTQQRGGAWPAPQQQAGTPLEGLRARGYLGAVTRRVLLVLTLITGCASAPLGVVRPGPTLALTRGRYVLPPEPPPPTPRSVEEQRLLEAQWPEVGTLRISNWQRPASFSSQPRRAEGPGGLAHCQAGDPSDAPCRGTPFVQTARPVRAVPVVVRANAQRLGTPPTILLEMR